MKWLAISCLLVVLCISVTSCCCGSARQGFQQGFEEAVKEAENSSTSTTSSDTTDTDDTGDKPTIDLGDPLGSGDSPSSADDIDLVDLTLGDAINEVTNEIINEISVFYPHEVIHASALLIDAPAGTDITAILVAEYVEVGGDILEGEDILELSLEANSESPLPLYWDFEPADDYGWPEGEYSVEFYVNGEDAGWVLLSVVPEDE